MGLAPATESAQSLFDLAAPVEPVESWRKAGRDPLGVCGFDAEKLHGRAGGRAGGKEGRAGVAGAVVREHGTDGPALGWVGALIGREDRSRDVVNKRTGREGERDIGCAFWGNLKSPIIFLLSCVVTAGYALYIN